MRDRLSSGNEDRERASSAGFGVRSHHPATAAGICAAMLTRVEQNLSEAGSFLRPPRRHLC
jgi:hypothetical protein